jgi:hypothetical protein
MLNLPSTTRGSFERAMYAGRSTPVKMQSKARTGRAIIIKHGGSTGERVRRIRNSIWTNSGFGQLNLMLLGIEHFITIYS